MCYEETINCEIIKPLFLNINITFDNDTSSEDTFIILNKDILEKLNTYKNKIETEVTQKNGIIVKIM